MGNQVLVLPTEVAKIADNVSLEKRSEVQSVLNCVFAGVTKMREQLDSVVVSSINDNVNMKLANTIRLGVRQIRLDAEKTFDAKRAEVQQQMLSYKTEDLLWLKAKQTMQILTKEIEENARWKEETKKRFEAEQKELKIQERMLKVSKVAPDILRSEFENMNDETFAMFLAGLEKAYNDKIEAERKAEEERIRKEQINELHNKRKEIAIPYYAYWSEIERTLNFGEVSDSDFNDFIERIKRLKSEDDKRIEAQRIENERLKKEREERERQLEEERAKAKAETEKKERQLAKEREEREEAEKKLKEEREKLEAERRAKAEAEKKERKAKELAEKKAKNAPDKTKLLEFVTQIGNLQAPEVKSNEAKEVLEEMERLLAKVQSLIREKCDNL